MGPTTSADPAAASVGDGNTAPGSSHQHERGRDGHDPHSTSTHHGHTHHLPHVHFGTQHHPRHDTAPASSTSSSAAASPHAPSEALRRGPSPPASAPASASEPASSFASQACDTGYDDEQEEKTVAGANRAALRKQSHGRPKGWITHALSTFMQLPNHTPLAALRWTNPKGPMPHILHLPSRDAGRKIAVYVFIPPNSQTSDEARPASPSSASSSASSKASHSSRFSRRSKSSRRRTPSPSASISTQASKSSMEESITPSFHGQRRPVMIDFHGGGFVMGGPLEQAPWCGALARSGILAMTVAYRLGPTWQFPAALLDAEDVIKAVMDADGRTEAGRYLRSELSRLSHGHLGIDEEKIALSGFSSGGNVALNMLLSIPAHLNRETAVQDISAAYDDEDDRKAKLHRLESRQDRDSEDWPSPFEVAQNRLRQIPALLFFPSLDVRQAPFDRKRPDGMAAPGDVQKFVGRALLNAYLPPEAVGHMRASPGLAPLGLEKGIMQEIAVRKAAAKKLGVFNTPMDTMFTDDPVPASDDEANGKGKVCASTSTVPFKQHPVPRRPSESDDPMKLDCMYPGTRALLILPELDNLSEQSEIWTHVLEAANKLITSPEHDGSLMSGSLASQTKATVRVHRVKGVSHGFTTFPDSFIDEKTRAAKKVVMEQARQFVVNMFMEDGEKSQS